MDGTDDGKPAIELPESAALAYDFGIWLKQKARFADALAAFQAARAGMPEDEAMLWNIAIAATGAGDGRAASEAWKKLGFEGYEGQRGADALPRMSGLPDVSVRLDGVEDVWVRPQSPVHGVVLTVPERARCAGYADVILWDAAPIEEVTAPSGKKVPRFPLLARLKEGGARTFAYRASGPVEAFAREWPDAMWLSPIDATRGHLVIEPELTVAEAELELERSRARVPELRFEVVLDSKPVSADDAACEPSSGSA